MKIEAYKKPSIEKSELAAVKPDTVVQSRVQKIYEPVESAKYLSSSAIRALRGDKPLPIASKEIKTL